jgi:hypothetical protein
MQYIYLDESTNGSCEYPIGAISKRWARRLWQLPAIATSKGGRIGGVGDGSPATALFWSCSSKETTGRGRRAPDLSGLRQQRYWRRWGTQTPSPPGELVRSTRSCAWWTTGSAALRGRRLVLIGAGVQQPLNKSPRATQAGELDAAPRIAVACAGEQDMSASEKFGFGWGGSRWWESSSYSLCFCGRIKYLWPPRDSKFYFLRRLYSAVIHTALILRLHASSFGCVCAHTWHVVDMKLVVRTHIPIKLC